MCGIAGIFAYHSAASAPDRAELLRIRDRMIRRGPDGAGEWWSKDRRVAFGHRRLSIIDLSDAGRQPMSSVCGRYAIVFNGEIYNYRNIRRELERGGAIFRSQSDTEVLLHLYARKGRGMVNDLRGMFAFVIWDQATGALFAARDPYGIKPLYYADDGWTFRFASQVKALRAGGMISDDPNPAGVCGYHLWGSVPDPHTLYRDIVALPAGCTLKVDAAGPHAPEPYVSLAEMFSAGAMAPVAEDEIEARVRDATREAVATHLVADVEIGLFLSAGIDSGALLGLMRDAGARAIRTITLGFTEFRGTNEDESILAAKVAAQYGAEHIVRFVGEDEFLTDLPAILDQMDQPSVDGVNTWFVSKAANEAGLKVALSGIGSDEILGGYPSFTDIPNWVRRMQPIGALPGAGAFGRWLLACTGAAKHNPKLAGLPEYGGSYPGAYLLRRGLFMPWELNRVLADPNLVADGMRRLAPLTNLQAVLMPDPKSPVSRVAVLESSVYMRNQLLRDADWASMAHSLEIRVPFVDIHLLRQLAPVTPQLSGRRGKEALALAPKMRLPDDVRGRSKTGFGVPTGAWLAKIAKGSSAAQTKGAASRGWGLHILKVQPDAPTIDLTVTEASVA